MGCNAAEIESSLHLPYWRERGWERVLDHSLTMPYLTGNGLRGAPWSDEVMAQWVEAVVLELRSGAQ